MSNNIQFRSLIICVDFDGTIVKDIFPNYPSEFIPDAKESLIELNNMGHILVLWTLRDRKEGYSHYLNDAIDFLNKNDLGFIKLPRHFNTTTPKFPADWFIDDKNIFGLHPWSKIIEEIRNKSKILEGAIK